MRRCVYVNGVGIVGPGLDNWQESLPILLGTRPYQCRETVWPSLTMIGAREQRRLTRISQLAFAAAQQALATSKVTLNEMKTVFASSVGDADIFNDLCINNAAEEGVISPTKFSYSLLNAAAGVWHLSTHNHNRSISVSANQHLVGSALLEALIQADSLPTLVVVYDIATPFPLNTALPIEHDFAFALFISPDKTAESSAKIRIDRLSQASEKNEVCKVDALEKLRQQNPAAQGLPLLSALAAAKPTTMTLSPLSVSITPC